MKHFPLIFFAFLIPVLSCGPSQKEFDQLKVKISELEQQLDECQNSATKKIIELRKLYSSNMYGTAVEKSSEILSLYPGTPEAIEADSISKICSDSISAAIKRKEEEEKRRIAEKEKALASLRKKTDSVENITWYRHRYSPEYVNYGNSIHLYFGIKNGIVLPLRLRIQYLAEEWLFVEGFTINIDGNVFRIPVSYTDMQRDNSAGIIWEWYDKPLGTEEKTIIEKIIDSKKAVLRYNGQKYRFDNTISKKEKIALKEIMSAYEAFKSN